MRIVYGAGEVGATADRFGERDARFWIAVDGDGDGIRKVLFDSPGVDVYPGPPARLLAFLPSTAAPGEEVCLTLAVLDSQGSGGFGESGVEFQGEISLRATLDEEPVEEGVPSSVVLDGRAPERCSARLRAPGPGILRVEAVSVDDERFRTQSNPLQVAAQSGEILWADLQVHSGLSDGTGRPADLLRYAREIAALDVVALTDHDHWGMLFLDQHPDMWQEIRDATREAHDPGAFVTLLGYEWTNWVDGHRHVLYFGDDGPLFSSIDPAYDTPPKLWAALEKGDHDAITIAHHSAGGPISVDWSIPPDPRFEPVTEIVSVHGSSEAYDSGGLLRRPVEGNFVRDALDRGYRFGFLGSTDGHDGHPGLAHLAAPSGGLAAIFSDDRSRMGVRDALRARRVYATNGPRILLRSSFGGYRMGEDVPVRLLTTDSGEQRGIAGGDGVVPGVPANTLVVQSHGVSALSHIDIIRSGAVIESVDCGGELRCSFGIDFANIRGGEYLYVRAYQKDGGAAWSSPFYFVTLESASEEAN